MMPGPCIICGDTDYPVSMGGPSLCPPCDCGFFGIARVRELGQVIIELRERLALAERNNRVDEALARQLSRSMQKNAELMRRIAELEQGVPHA